MPDSQTRSARDAEVAAILYGHPEEVGALVERLRKLIGECCPDAREKVHPGWKIVACSLGKPPTWGVFCYVGPVKGGVSLGFNQGVSLSDPLGLLEGNAKNSRHVKFREGQSPDWEAVRELIEAAYALAVWKQQPDYSGHRNRWPFLPAMFRATSYLLSSPPARFLGRML